MNWTVSTGDARKRASVAVVLVGALAVLPLSDIAAAAEISVNAPPATLAEKIGGFNRVIDLSGAIDPGDAQRLEGIVSDLQTSIQQSGVDGFGVVLRLKSPGGSFKEAIEIARIVKSNQIQTFLEAGSECLSACAVIFMAGTYQPGFRAQEERWRKVEWPARLGFHRPFIQELAVDVPPEMLEQFTAEEIQSVFNDEYLTAFDVANELIQEMLSVDPAAWSPELLVQMLTATSKSEEGQFIYLATVDDALIWGIDVINAEPPAGNSKRSRYIENFWLCYNAGRAIPAYAGIWPDIPTAEETLNEHLPQCCGRPGAFWDSKMVDDDDLTYWARVRGFNFGCTIRYEEFGGKPTVTFFHDDATVTQTELLQRHNPGLSLDGLIARTEPRAAGTGERQSGLCYVYRREAILDEEPCTRSTRTDPALGLVESYTWPSGSRTVVVRGGSDVTLNGSAVRRERPRRDSMAFCYRSRETGNTFCFEES
jgi:hypothetical protein